MKHKRIDDATLKELFKVFEVGDAVYYKAPKPSYAVRKSTVVEVVTAQKTEGFFEFSAKSVYGYIVNIKYEYHEQYF